jgi:hypothetical protein
MLKDIKSSLNNENVKVEPLGKTSSKILINQENKIININKIITQLNKHKITVTEANVLKPNLDEIFRKITQNNKVTDKWI